MDSAEVDRVLDALQQLQSAHELSILKLSEPIASALPQPQQTGPDPTTPAADGAARTSDVSTASSSLDAPTPASLDADLAHYRELFAKLRFSYVEQVTKEKFLRAIVGDPPLIVTPGENVALEARNAAAKARLRARKAEVADAVAELDRRGRRLARRYADVAADTERLRALPARAAELQEAVARLREAQREQERQLVASLTGEEEDPNKSAGGGGEGGGELGGRPELRLPLARTLDLVAERRKKLAELDRQLEQLSTQAPRKRKEAERLQAELGPLEARRQNSATAAREARKRKEAALGGAEDDLEERGRWWRASEAVLRQMLEV